MANVPEEPVWQDGIYQIENNDEVRGGPLPEGIANLQGKQLADRTNYLKEQAETESSNRKEADDDLQSQISILKGRGGYLTAHDFGNDDPTQQALTQYALTQIGQTDQTLIWDKTHVKNMNNGHVWVLNNTPANESKPAVFEWIDDGLDSVSIANNDGIAGIVKGGRGDDEVSVSPDGTMKVPGLANSVKRGEMGAKNGVATLDSDEKIPIGQIPAAIINSVANKADKVTGAVNGNFAGLNAEGNLTDSGKKPGDFVQTAEKGAAGGVATLGANGIVPGEQLPGGGQGLLSVAHDGTLTGSGSSSSPLGVNIPNINATLTDAAESNTLPAANASTPITALLQTVRNNLKHLFNNKLNKSGDTMTGAIGVNTNTVLKSELPNYKGDFIKVYDGDTSGAEMVIQSGGQMIIGAGEAASSMHDGLGVSAAQSATEQMYVASDNDVTVVTNIQNGFTSRKSFVMGSNGNLTVPGHINVASKSTAAANSPTAVATEAQVFAKVDKSVMGTASGVATLGSDGKIPTGQIPSLMTFNHTRSMNKNYNLPDPPANGIAVCVASISALDGYAKYIWAPATAGTYECLVFQVSGRVEGSAGSWGTNNISGGKSSYGTFSANSVVVTLNPGSYWEQAIIIYKKIS